MVDPVGKTGMTRAHRAQGEGRGTWMGSWKPKGALRGRICRRNGEKENGRKKLKERVRDPRQGMRKAAKSGDKKLKRMDKQI